MKGWIQTNMMDVDVDTDVLDGRYGFVVVSDDGTKPWGRLAEAADKLTETGGVASVRFQRFGDDQRVYVMLEKEENDCGTIRPILDDIGDSFRFETITGEELWRREPCILVQLLLNSLSKETLFGSEFNNLSGRCLYIRNDWIKKSGFKALEFSIDPFLADKKKMLLSMSVTTFTKASVFENDNRLKGKARYRLNGFVPIRTSMDDKNGFINKAHGDKRNSVDYLVLDSEKYNGCKIGIFNGLVNLYNSVHEGMSHMRLVQFEERERIDTPTILRFQTPFENRLKDVASSTEICIVDLEKDEKSGECLKSLALFIKNRLGKNAVISESPIDGAFNLCIIHDKRFYEGKDGTDPHRMHADKGVQHITIEELGSGDISDAVMNVIVKELMIKDDLRRGSISLYDWKALGLEGDVSFSSCHIVTEGRMSFPDSYYTLTVHPDGSFNYSSTSLMDSGCEDTFLWETDCRAMDPEYIVTDWRGNRCIVRRTNLTPIPDDEGMRSCFRGYRKNGPRGCVNKDNYINCILDLSISEMDGRTYFISGYNRNNLDSVLKKSPNIRWIESTPGSEKLKSLMLELMKVPFVRYNQLTVAPFPIKYLNEVMRMDGVPEPCTDEIEE